MYVHVEMQVQYAFVFFELNYHEQVCILSNVCVEIKSITRRLGKKSMKIQVENCNEFPETPVAVSFFVRCSKKSEPLYDK